MGLDRVRQALEAVSAEHLQAFSLPQSVPKQVAPIFAWLRHAADWELERRAGRIAAMLHDPTFNAGDIDSALLALDVLARQFHSRDKEAEDVERFLVATAECLRGTIH